MAVNQKIIAELVRRVLEELSEEKGLRSENSSGLHHSVEEAVEHAVEAQKRLIAMSLDSRAEMIAAIR